MYVRPGMGSHRHWEKRKAQAIAKGDEAAAAAGRGEEAVVAGPGEVTVARRHELTVLVCEAAVHGEFGVSVCTPSLGVGREVGYKEERKVAVR